MCSHYKFIYLFIIDYKYKYDYYQKTMNYSFYMDIYCKITTLMSLFTGRRNGIRTLIVADSISVYYILI